MNEDATQTFTLEGEDLEFAKALVAIVLTSGRSRTQQFLIVAAVAEMCDFDMTAIIETKIN